MEFSALDKARYEKYCEVTLIIHSMLAEYRDRSGKPANAVFLGYDVYSQLAASQGIVYRDEIPARISMALGKNVYCVSDSKGVIGVGEAVITSECERDNE